MYDLSLICGSTGQPEASARMDGGQQRDAADHAGQGVGETEPTGRAGIRLLGISFRAAIVDWLLETFSVQHGMWTDNNNFIKNKGDNRPAAIFIVCFRSRWDRGRHLFMSKFLVSFFPLTLIGHTFGGLFGEDSPAVMVVLLSSNSSANLPCFARVFKRRGEWVIRWTYCKNSVLKCYLNINSSQDQLAWLTQAVIKCG